MKLNIINIDTKIDERGLLAELLQNPYKAEVRHIFVATVNPNRKKEWFCILHGKLTFVFENPDTKEKRKFYFSDNHVQIVEVPTNIAHKVVNESNELAIFVSLVNETFDPQDPDTYFYKIV